MLLGIYLISRTSKRCAKKHLSVEENEQSGKDKLGKNTFWSFHSVIVGISSNGFNRHRHCGGSYQTCHSLENGSPNENGIESDFETF